MTRRAFVPKAIVQLYKATPTLSAFLANAEPIMGGVSPVTVPVQGTAMVTTSATDYAGSFAAPQVQTGLLNAEFNLKAVVTPIPFYVMEGLAQVDASVIPIIEARMNDAGNSIADYLSSFLWTASTSNLDIWSIPDIINTANPARANYGGIERGANTWWQGNLKTIGALGTGGTTWTRQNVMAAIASCVNASGGEMPTFGIMGIGGWATLAMDFAANERYLITPEASFDEAAMGARALFTALQVAGVPIYADPYSADTQLTLFNASYLGFKIHADAAFAVAGPESLLPNFQLGWILVLVALIEAVCSKPKSQTRVTGFTGSITP